MAKRFENGSVLTTSWSCRSSEYRWSTNRDDPESRWSMLDDDEREKTPPVERPLVRADESMTIQPNMNIVVHPTYIRGNVIAGQGCVLGNSSEFKNCLLLDAVQAPHFNYVGDSILGNGAHLGAGVILANLRLDQQNVPVVTAEGRRDSGLRKLGGLFGGDAEAGCNTVINPGTLLGRRAVVMPGNPFSGYLAEGEIALTVQEVRRIKRRG